MVMKGADGCAVQQPGIIKRANYQCTMHMLPVIAVMNCHCTLQHLHIMTCYGTKCIGIYVSISKLIYVNAHL